MLLESKMLQGWKLLGLIAAVLLLMAAVILAAHPDVAGVRMLIRASARSSLLLFCLAFTASALSRLWPGVLTRWLLGNRRYLGLSFAFSHGVHAIAIYGFARLDPVGFRDATMIGTDISGGIAYVLILAMVLTSFDRGAAWIGRRAWAVLHTSGAYYLWLSFSVSFGRRALHNPHYCLPVAIVVAALAIRLLGMSWRREGSTLRC